MIQESNYRKNYTVHRSAPDLHLNAVNEKDWLAFLYTHMKGVRVIKSNSAPGVTEARPNPA